MILVVRGVFPRSLVKNCATARNAISPREPEFAKNLPKSIPAVRRPTVGPISGKLLETSLISWILEVFGFGHKCASKPQPRGRQTNKGILKD
eukprot:3212025-Amphidinium_carterae.1